VHVREGPLDPDSTKTALDAIAAVQGGQTGDPTQGPHGQVNTLVESLLSDPDNFCARLYNTIAAYVAVGSSLAVLAAAALEIDQLEVLTMVDKQYEDIRAKPDA
jgi:hypothetical protein